MARHGSGEEDPRRWPWLEHAYLDDIDLHQLIEQSLDGDNCVVTALLLGRLMMRMLPEKIREIDRL